jgi:hypothetical protein
MIEMIKVLAQKSMETSVVEGLKETAIRTLKESPIQNSLETVENSSLERVKAQNELFVEKINAEKIEQLEKNREAGANREELAHKELQKELPEDEGYKIEREQYLRDKEGNIVKDPDTGQARRIDFIVYKDGEVVKNIEVTSDSASKVKQMQKEDNIRKAGGDFIKDRDTGQLIEIPKNIKTDVTRYA